MELEKSYNAEEYETNIYQKWLDSGYFNPDNLPNQHGKPYTIVLPPPNVTGTMHVGHALGATIQDILIRYHRMKGFRSLWLPGTDHASIATQSKVEKILEKEQGLRKTDLGREKFLQQVETFAQQSHDTITTQLQKLGSSLDWSREAYTLDQQRNLAVRTAFVKMYEDGLIYRDYKVINWDPKGQTVISDEEIVYQEREAVLYTFKYSKDFPIAISTTRPETKVGDTAVAVHPNDTRYQHLIGTEYDLEFAGVPLHLKIIADETVEPEFGTGALGVTPAHSFIDAEIAQRHNLPMKPVIDQFAKMTVEGKLHGLKTTQAREEIVNWLRESNLLEQEETIKQNVATAERSGGIIEPLPKLQWFVAVNKPFTLAHSDIPGIQAGQNYTLKDLMKQVVESNQITITPNNQEKIYLHWVNNLRDWCISRQIWFGHRIPVWYKGNPQNPTEIYCGVNPPEGFIQNSASTPASSGTSEKAVINDSEWKQDEDTLDTWFSSGLWTFSTLGWPEQTTDLTTYHPTDVLETAYDILFFWVARMVLMSTYLIGQVPFKQVFLHGLIRDAKNRKMSKSLGNIIDPLEMTGKYGTDALRFALIFNTAPGTDTALAEDKIKGMKHFGNKLWNITRFIISSCEDISVDAMAAKNFHSKLQTIDAVTPADIEILDKLTKTIEVVTENIDKLKLHESAQALYDFIWKEFADIYLEQAKPQLTNSDSKENTQVILVHSLIQILKITHPFMPFLTEVLWDKLKQANLINPDETDLLMIESWPK